MQSQKLRIRNHPQINKVKEIALQFSNIFIYRKVEFTMALIQVSPDLLNAKAQELRGLKAQHEEAMAKMRTLILGLNEIWKGDAQDAFVAKYESMQPTFTNFAGMLEDYAKLMDTAAQKLQETDQGLQTTMNSFGA